MKIKKKKRQLKIIIAGLPKSGTTALFWKIKNSVSSSNGLICMFEPKGFIVPQEYHPKRGILAKILIDGYVDYDSFNNFHKKILLVRDPRDIIISRLLYRAGYHVIWKRHTNEIIDHINLIRKKERLPGTISVVKLYESLVDMRITELKKFYQSRFELFCKFYNERKDYFLVHYEDFIYNKTNALERYLGFRLVRHIKVDDNLIRVVRTKSSGNWKDWFTPEDVFLFKPLCYKYMKMFNYDFTDWSFNKKQKILPKHASEYVKRLVNERREKNGLERIEA